MRWPWQRNEPEPAVSATAPAVTFAAPLSWDAFPWWQQANDGQRVTRDFALSVSSVLKGRNIVADTIASRPLRVLDANNNVIRSPLLEQIDPDVANPITMASTVEDLLFDGIAWWQVLARDFDDYPVYARRIDPMAVSAQPPPGYVLADLPSGFVPGSTLWVAGVPVRARDMLRFDSTRPALCVVGARTIRRAYRLEAAAEMYSTSPQMRGWFTPTDGADPEQTIIDGFLKDFAERRQAGADGYVPSAFERHTEQAPTAADLQLTAIIEKTTVAVAALFSLDPEDLGVSTTSRTYQNAVDRRQDKKNETFAGITSAIEARLSMGDVTRRGQSALLLWDGYLQPNPTDRATIAQTFIDAKVITADEARHDEGRPPLTAAQKRELNPPAPTPAPAVNGPQGPAQGAEPSNVVPIRRAGNFSGDPVGLTFDLADVEDSFQVDVTRRTITGLVMPWGEIGRSGGKKWRFVPGALKYRPGAVAQIKFMVDHAPTQPVGYMVRTWADERGQWGTYKVGRGPAGDQALRDAQDRVRDGLSAGIGFAADESDIAWVPDPADPTVRLVTAAPWRETSLVALPAFAGARVSAVQMAADQIGEAMHCQHCGQIHAAGVACPVITPPTATPPAPTPAPVTYTAEQVAAMFAALPAPTPAPVPAEPPAVVNPTTLPMPTAQVVEQPLYRFDGNPAQRCFTADIATRFNGDAELRGKAEKFIADAMAAAFAPITPGNVATLNPNIQRPDLYVPSLHFTRVMGEMTTGGVVTSLTKSTLPKFGTASGLAAAHVTGTEPVEGTFTTTSQEVAPAPISGELKVDREVVDQGGSPLADQIMWNEMTQFYAELLETRLVDAFQALALVDEAIIGVNDILQADILGTFAKFQYLKGGDRYRALALHQAMYSAIIGAVDGNKRLLFPLIAPQNSAGVTASDLSLVNVAGKIGRPAWGLETANGGPAKSFLWVPGSVYQWFAPPRRIDLNAIAVAYVAIGIWGYSAEFITRPTDVIQLSYAAA